MGAPEIAPANALSLQYVLGDSPTLWQQIATRKSHICGGKERQTPLQVQLLMMSDFRLSGDPYFTSNILLFSTNSAALMR